MLSNIDDNSPFTLNLLPLPSEALASLLLRRSELWSCYRPMLRVRVRVRDEEGRRGILAVRC
jgi:hypothetical protein